MIRITPATAPATAMTASHLNRCRLTNKSGSSCPVKMRSQPSVHDVKTWTDQTVVATIHQKAITMTCD
ncbi:hypothetical protein VI03_25275 [Burkholderia vietnamiensis]|nr:hypothetical protein VI03_25275 [Burkholderia vietnamiensis]